MNTITGKINSNQIPEILPVIPTMDVVVFPHMIVPLLVLDEKIIGGINRSVEQSKLALLLASKKEIGDNETISTSDLYELGTIATIMRVIKLPEGGMKILVQGLCKARAKEIIAKDKSLEAQIEIISPKKGPISTLLRAQVQEIKHLSEKASGINSNFSPDFHSILFKMDDAEKIIDFILSHLDLTITEAQELLSMTDQVQILERLHGYLSKEIEVSQLQEKIKSNARESMNQQQRHYYLREQLNAIKRELGEEDSEDISRMLEKLESLAIDEESKAEVKRQINRLEKTAPESMEAAVTRNHLEWIFALPWGKSDPENLDLEHAQTILDNDHCGLEEIKERILDFISIKKLKNDGCAPILCFVGPPGTGKTSLGKSIARALGRSYSRISLGGVKDEAEIRGHRRTYVGAMPGRFIQAIRKAGSMNALIVIDELDKLGSDFRGDPSSAMLEVLDANQNIAFHDNYLAIPFDLSHIMFVATANNLDTIPGPLRDRMEVINLSGYTREEKLNIAKQYLVPKNARDSGLSQELHLPDGVLKDIIAHYTREAGVRELERVIKKLCSKAARCIVEHNCSPLFSQHTLEQYLGPYKFINHTSYNKPQVGITNGLAWTPFGGEVLKIEAVLMPGRGKLILTGQLGEIMRESAMAARSYTRAHADKFGIPKNTFSKYDIHIHVPAGAVQKDGPSAGITMLTSILSACTNRPINANYAMTGELNLQGQIMAIGGVKEKLLAAQDLFSHVFLPSKNRNDLHAIANLIKNVNVIFVDHAQEVLDTVLLDCEK